MRYALVALAACALCCALPARAAPPDGCYAMRADSTGQLMSHGGPVVPGYFANRTDLGPWERFCVVGTPEGTHLIQGEDGKYLSARGGGVVQKAWVPGEWERWRFAQGPGGTWGLTNVAHGGWLSADKVLAGVVTTKGAFDAWERWHFEATDGCPCSSMAEPDIATDVTPAPRGGPLFGVADTHAHPFSDLAFGGTTLHGSAFDALGVHGALHQCHFTHGPDSATDLIGLAVNHEQHANGGYPNMDGWPTHANVNHQQMYHAWMERAWRGGMRLQVMLAVNNKLLCHASKITAAAAYAMMASTAIVGIHPPPPPDLTASCDDMASMKRQVAAAKALEAYIDQRSGGPGEGWYRIAYSPVEARRIIEQGKMAVVLGVEVDTLFGCTATGPCDMAEVERQLDEMHALGVRHVYPIHVLDNAFGGAAQYNPMFVAANVLENGQPFSITECDDATLKARMEWTDLGPVCDVLDKVPGAGPELGQICRGRPPPGTVPPGVDRHCNARGLTPRGEQLVNMLMDRGMIIDTDHTSARALEGILAIAEARGYPLVSGHAGLVERIRVPSEAHMAHRDITRFRRLGGLVSPILHSGHTLDEVKPFGERIPHACAGSTTSWAQNYLYAVDAMGGPDVAAVPLGSDLNGMISQPAPRFGERACHGQSTPANPRKRVEYPFPAHGQKGTFGQLRTGHKLYDYNVDGLANVGLFPDWVQDLKAIGLTERDLAPLFRSAEGYVKLWEKADGKPAGYTRVPLSQEASMSWQAAVDHCAAQGKRLANRADVCPDGPESAPRYGRPEGDVWMAVGDMPNAWISVGTAYTERRCKFHRHAHGAAPAWGTDRGPEPVTGQPAALRCVDYTRLPLGLGRPAMRTVTWRDAEGYCAARGLTLATRADLCPDGPAGEPRYGRVPGDVWLAVGDAENAWLSVGESYAPERKCKLHREVYGRAPPWGGQKGPEPVTGREPAAVVCRPR